MVEKLGLPFPLLSDPRGDLIKASGLWNEKEGVSEPAILVLDQQGTVRYLYSGGSDFSDRPPLEVLLGLLERVDAQGEPEVSEPELRVSAEEAEKETVRPERPAQRLEALGPYYRGAYFSTIAMQKKLEGEAREEVDEYQRLVKEYSDAIRETARRGS
jgi:hypothetical protein